MHAPAGEKKRRLSPALGSLAAPLYIAKYRGDDIVKESGKTRHIRDQRNGTSHAGVPLHATLGPWRLDGLVSNALLGTRARIDRFADWIDSPGSGTLSIDSSTRNWVGTRVRIKE